MHYTVVTQSNTSVAPSIYDLVFLAFLHGLLVSLHYYMVLWEGLLLPLVQCVDI